jgi:6-phosphogluconolactonase (cycloisomerase 2 family)
LRLEADGALTLTAHIALGGVPSQVVVHPGGRWAVALVRGADLCAVVRLDPLPVTMASSVACRGSPRAATWDADLGLVVAMQKGGRVDRYGFDGVTGALSFDRTMAKVKGAAGLALL